MDQTRETQRRIEELHDLIGEYWSLAYQEGALSRVHDTEEGAAQQTWMKIKAAILDLAYPQAKVYLPCLAHQGMPFSFTATVARPAIQVCPLCEEKTLRDQIK